MKRAGAVLCAHVVVSVYYRSGLLVAQPPPHLMMHLTLKSLGQSLQNGVDLFSDCCQRKLKLVLCANHARPLITNVFQCGCNINLLHSFSHSVEYHVNQDIGPSPTCTITAVYNNWTGSAPVALVHLPAKIQQWACGGGDALRWPAQEVKLGKSSGFLGLDILQVEAAHQEILTPDVF